MLESSRVESCIILEVHRKVGRCVNRTNGLGTLKIKHPWCHPENKPQHSFRGSSLPWLPCLSLERLRVAHLFHLVKCWLKLLGLVTAVSLKNGTWLRCCGIAVREMRAAKSGDHKYQLDHYVQSLFPRSVVCCDKAHFEGYPQNLWSCNRPWLVVRKCFVSWWKRIWK